MDTIPEEISGNARNNRSEIERPFRIGDSMIEKLIYLCTDKNFKGFKIQKKFHLGYFNPLSNEINFLSANEIYEIMYQLTSIQQPTNEGFLSITAGNFIGKTKTAEGMTIGVMLYADKDAGVYSWRAYQCEISEKDIYYFTKL